MLKGKINYLNAKVRNTHNKTLNHEQGHSVTVFLIALSNIETLPQRD